MSDSVYNITTGLVDSYHSIESQLNTNDKVALRKQNYDSTGPKWIIMKTGNWANSAMVSWEKKLEVLFIFRMFLESSFTRTTKVLRSRKLNTSA